MMDYTQNLKRLKGMNNYIKLHRSLTDWEWYKDAATKQLFLHLLLSANTEDKLWQGNCIGKGQCIKSITVLSEETGLTISEIRKSIDNLKSTSEIMLQNCGKYHLYTVVNYEKYFECEVRR